MAKEKFNRTKPHVNVGTIGHIDHGKSTTHRRHRGRPGRAKAWLKVKSYSEITKGGTVRDDHQDRDHRRLARRVRDRPTVTTPTSTARATPTSSRT
jgi:translation initiation factor 2 gamma subunit (eIF-2gamma)